MHTPWNVLLFQQMLHRLGECRLSINYYSLQYFSNVSNSLTPTLYNVRYMFYHLTLLKLIDAMFHHLQSMLYALHRVNQMKNFLLLPMQSIQAQIYQPCPEKSQSFEFAPPPPPHRSFPGHRDLILFFNAKRRSHRRQESDLFTAQLYGKVPLINPYFIIVFNLQFTIPH